MTNYDIEPLKRALAFAGIASPESREELALRWDEYAQRVVRYVDDMRERGLPSWQTVDSYPSDADVVLVCNPEAGSLPVLARRIEGTWYQSGIYGAQLRPEPTHWMMWPKLPPAPQPS